LPARIAGLEESHGWGQFVALRVEEMYLIIGEL
jgi:hypothetical protein